MPLQPGQIVFGARIMFKNLDDLMRIASSIALHLALRDPSHAANVDSSPAAARSQYARAPQ